MADPITVRTASMSPVHPRMYPISAGSCLSSARSVRSSFISGHRPFPLILLPADNGVRLNDRQRLTSSWEQPIDTNEYQSVDGTEGEFLWSSPPQDVYLLPQRPNLCLKRCPRPDQIDNRPTNEPAKIPHRITESPDSRSTASRIRFAAGTARSDRDRRRQNQGHCLHGISSVLTAVRARACGPRLALELHCAEIVARQAAKRH
jgi:hypothetical protein